MNQQQYIKSHGVHVEGRLKKIKKSSSPSQVIFEAFTNALESLKILNSRWGVKKNNRVEIILYFKNSLLLKEEYYFDQLEVIDTGIGFDDKEYGRLLTLDDGRKGFSNQGTGRVQFLHVFDKTKVSSVYRDTKNSTTFRKRELTLSKGKSFLEHDAIIRLEAGNEDKIEEKSSSSHIVFRGVLESKDQNYFNGLSIEGLKESIVTRYLTFFCNNRNDLPEIIIKLFHNEVFQHQVVIDIDSIPELDKEEKFKVNYSAVQGKTIIKSEKTALFKLKSFKVPDGKLAKNELKITSKGEVVENVAIRLGGLLEKDNIDGYRYIFLLSGHYIDEKDSDTRGVINIPRKSDLIKDQGSLFPDENIIILDDIEDKVNDTIMNSYNEIKCNVKERDKNIKKLQKMFLLDPKVLKTLQKKINYGDTDNVILKKVYQVDAELAAKADAKMKQKLEELDALDPSSHKYQEILTRQIDELVKAIPQQNRTVLTHYVARRKLVLELFDKILKKQLKIQKATKRSIDEKLLHNLVFQQASNEPDQSDLWLVNEDFIYFNGTSEGKLGAILLDGKEILKDKRTEEEETYRLKQEGDAHQKRPDILLFPKEGKCIIIEFKSLNTNISAHLNQINRYASLINNLSKDTFQFSSYYGYLVGENIDVDDVQDNDSDFISAYELDYLYRPHKRIIGKFGRSDGSLYTEVIKYSTLLKRALMRNKIFIDKITKAT